jgi:hypothetical protein
MSLTPKVRPWYPAALSPRLPGSSGDPQARTMDARHRVTTSIARVAVPRAREARA